MTADERSGARVTHTAVVYIGLGVTQHSLNLLLLPLITRVVSPTEYGEITTIVVVTLLVGVVLGGALEVPLTRAAARGGSGAARVAGWARIYLVWLIPAICMLGSAAVWLLSEGGSHGKAWSIELAAVGLSASLTYYAQPVTRGSDRLAAYVLLTTTSVVTLAVTKFVFLSSFEDGVLAWVCSDLFAAVVAWLSVMVVVRPKRIRWLASREDDAPATINELVRACIPLAAHRAAFWSLNSLNRPAVAIFMSFHSVGIYSLATNIAGVSMTLLAEFNRAVLVEYARERWPAPAGTRRIAQAQLLAALAVPACIATGVLLLGDLVIGHDYHSGIPLVGILLIGQVLYGVYLIPMNYLTQTAGKYQWSSYASVVGAAVILLALVVAGALNSLTAACIGTVAGYATLLLMAIALTRVARLPIKWLAVLPRTLVAVPLLVAAGSSLAILIKS
ncbi:MAG: lipopolysaccharide biosynthesis protein [Aeromicrobium sp.]